MWIQTAVSAASAVCGGFVGGCVVAFRLGSWRQEIEDRLRVAEDRLAKGDEHVGSVPVLKARLDIVIEELRAIKFELRQDRKQFVSHEECDRRHQDAHA
jgi:hypothetical protein